MSSNTQDGTPRSRGGARKVVLSLALLVLAGAGGLPTRAGEVVERNAKTIIRVKVFRLPEQWRTDPATRADAAAVRAFVEGFPALFAAKYRARYEADPETYGVHDWGNVSVELERFTGIRVEGVEVDLLGIAGGMAPDILYINFRKSDNYIQSRFLYPLDRPEDGYLAALSDEQKAFRIHPRIWPVIRRTGPDGETHVWAMPYGGAIGKVLLYRKDLFDRCGLAYPSSDWTWDDMYAAARALTDPRQGTYGIKLGRGKHESWYWCTFLWSAGGDVMAYNEEEGTWRCVFDSPEAAVALDYYTRLTYERWEDKEGRVRRGYAYQESGDAGVKWRRGEIGMQLAYIDEKLFSQINPEVTGMAPVPLGPTGLRGGELNSRMMGLFSGIEEPAVRDAAWEYMRFYDSRQATAIRTRVMVEGGLGRFINPKYLRLFGYPEIERLSPPGWAENFDIAIETGRPEPYGRNSNLAYDLMTIPIHEAQALARNDALPADDEARLAMLHDLLRRANARANEAMIGLVPPRERRLRRLAAALLLTAIAVVFTFVFRRITSTFSPTDTVTGQRQGWQFRRYGWAYLILVPALLSIGLWHYIPLLRGSVMAFFDYQLIGTSDWVGLDNFGDLIFDRDWWTSLYNSLRYSLLVIGLTFLPPIILAVLLQEVPHGKIFFRVIYYLPAVVTGLVTILLWKQFYDPSDRGVLNGLVLRIPAIGFLAIGAALATVAFLFTRRLWLHELRWQAWAFSGAGVLMFLACATLARPMLFHPGESLAQALLQIPVRLVARTPEAYEWLNDPDSAMIACVIPMVWAGMGPGCLIYLAALKGIPEDYYEAADIDGASFIDKILFVVFPTLKALVIINFVGVFISSWYGATANILAMTGGGAGTEVAGLHIWYKAFTFLKFGPATAAAWMLGFMLIGFTVHQLRILSRVEFRAQGVKE